MSSEPRRLRYKTQVRMVSPYGDLWEWRIRVRGRRFRFRDIGLAESKREAEVACDASLASVLGVSS